MITRGDCLDVMRGMEDGEVDVTICDPPYTEYVHKNVKNTYIDGRKIFIDIDFDPIDPRDYVSELLRVTRRWVIAFCAFEQIGDYYHAAKDAWVRTGVYRKFNSTPQISGDRPGQSCDAIAIMHRKVRKRWNGGGRHAFFEHARERDELRVHPTQKPVALMCELVKLFSDSGELVFDPFCGSGTTGVAAIRLGRRFLGVEKSEKYAAIADERLRAELSQLSLRDARSGQMSMLDRSRK